MGEGPAVVVPRLNIDWTQVDLSALTDRFRVVLVAPRGFGPSSRPGAYDMAGFVDDIDRVLDHLGVGSFDTFGYSMNGVMAARLALGTDRVRAVACGGFPLTADLAGMGDRARARNDAARDDPGSWAEILQTYDPLAAEVFWDGIASLPRAALADLDHPVRLWWGQEDGVLASLVSPAKLRRDLESRAIPYDVVPGLDHDEMLRHLDLVLPSIADWLEALPALDS